jgi:hypothetical protein
MISPWKIEAPHSIYALTRSSLEIDFKTQSVSHPLLIILRREYPDQEVSSLNETSRYLVAIQVHNKQKNHSNMSPARFTSKLNGQRILLVGGTGGVGVSVAQALMAPPSFSPLLVRPKSTKSSHPSSKTIRTLKTGCLATPATSPVRTWKRTWRTCSRNKPTQSVSEIERRTVSSF